MIFESRRHYCILKIYKFALPVDMIRSNELKFNPMHRRKPILYLLLLFLFACFSSCTKNDDSTIILLGPESYVDDMIATIPDALCLTFEEQFGEIPMGYVPPKVEGFYVVAPKQRCYSNVPNWPLSVVEPNMTLSLSNQHNSVVELNLAEATETFSDTVFIVGHDNLFSVFYQEWKEMTVNAHDVVMKRGIIIKGEMCDEGIKDLFFATIVMEVDGDEDNVLAQPGQYFIYRDGDGLAEKKEEEE